MKKSEIDKIKKAGVKEHLLLKTGQLLFEIKLASENASRDYFKNFQKEIIKIRRLADDAEDLWKEAFG